MKKIVPFLEVSELSFGGKANNLATLYQNGFNIPNGFIIPATILEEKIGAILNNLTLTENEIKEVILKNRVLFEDLIMMSWEYAIHVFGSDFKVAIRSSVNLEDGKNDSFAGQFSTTLEVDNYEDFTNSFMDCLLSKYNDEVISYCKSKNIKPTDLQINIIIQEMVAADFSGVCFTVNPITGNEKEMLIESVKGLGEKLVSGQITPSTYYVDWYNNKISKKTNIDDVVLTDKMIFNIVNKSLEIQQYYGLAQDIEWSIKDDKLYILQARPLTAIQFESKYDWTNADLKDGGISSEITTPFMYKLYEYAFETTMAPYLKSVKLHPTYKPKKWFTQYMLFSYWNLSATKDGVKKIPGFIEKEFDEDLGVKPRYEGKGHVTKLSLKSAFNGVKILLAINKSIKKTIKNAPKELAEINDIIKKNKGIDWENLTDEIFVKKAKTLINKDFLTVEGSYFVVIYNNSNLTTLFKDLLQKKKKNNSIQYLKLITGLQNLSHLQPSFALWKLSREILENNAHVDFYKSKSTKQLTEDYLNKKDIPLLEKLKKFIDKYGFHSEKELDISTPNWHENPTQVFATLLNFIDKPATENIIHQNEKQKLVFEKEFYKIKSKKLQKEIKKHRYFLWLREEYRDCSSQMYDIIRSVYLIAGKRLVEKQIIKTKEDIFFSNPNSIDLLFNNNANQIDKIAKNKVIYKSFRNFDKPNEIWSNKTLLMPEKILKTDNNLNGIACSYGVIEGDIYIAKTVNEANEMPNGKIMVTQFTNPAWTVYFSKISGLITETGGMLSHGAIISREYGIPAVLGVSNCTKILKTGDRVRLNGNSGVIEIIK